MAYLTHSELASRVGSDQLDAFADYDGDGSYDPAVVTQALEDASDTVDGYVSSYTPFASPYPESIVDATAVIANWRMRGDRDQITDYTQRRYDEIMRWLRDVANGVAVIPGIDDEYGDDPGAPTIDAGDRVWTRDSGRRVF